MSNLHNSLDTASPFTFRHGGDPRPVPAGLPTGYPALDAALPGGGWPLGALTEIVYHQTGSDELSVALPALARLSQEGRWLAWIAPPHIPIAPTLAAHGVNLSRILLVHPRPGSDGLRTVEMALRAGTCGAVLAWPAGGDESTLRRLQEAAAASKAWCLLFRDAHTARPPAAAVGLRVETARDGRSAQILNHASGPAGQHIQLELASRPAGDNSEILRSVPTLRH